jgi:hypothetical protein
VTSLSSASASSTSFSESDMPLGGFFVYLVCAPPAAWERVADASAAVRVRCGTRMSALTIWTRSETVSPRYTHRPRRSYPLGRRTVAHEQSQHIQTHTHTHPHTPSCTRWSGASPRPSRSRAWACCGAKSCRGRRSPGRGRRLSCYPNFPRWHSSLQRPNFTPPTRHSQPPCRCLVNSAHEPNSLLRPGLKISAKYMAYDVLYTYPARAPGCPAARARTRPTRRPWRSSAWRVARRPAAPPRTAE